jgi:lactoylglutathione lyase
MGLTHLAISLGTESAVREVTERLKARGVTVLDGPRRTGDGYYESVILDPEGNRIELMA